MLKTVNRVLAHVVAGTAIVVAIVACGDDASPQGVRTVPEPGSYENPIAYTGSGSTVGGYGKHFCIDNFEYIYIDRAMTPVFDTVYQKPKFCGNR